MAIFTIEALRARSVGCIINDFTDRYIDIYVDRTKARTLTTSELSKTQTDTFLALLMCCNFYILFSLP